MNRIARLFVAVGGACLICGCGGFGGGIIGQQQPKIRVFNGVDGQASISVLFVDQNGHALGTSGAAPFAGTTAQDAIIANTNARATVQAGTTALFTGPSNEYRINTQYSLYAAGVPGNYAAVTLNDVPDPGNTAGSADVRTVHVGAHTAAVDVYIVAATPGGVSGSPLFASVSFGQSTIGTSSATVDGNGYALTPVTDGSQCEVIITAHGSSKPLAATTAYLNAYVFYTVVVYDSGSGTGVTALADRH